MFLLKVESIIENGPFFSLATLLLVVLFYLITAKRYGFIHAFIGFITCIFMLSGIYLAVMTFAPNAINNEYFLIYEKCTELFNYVTAPVINLICEKIGAQFIEKIGNYLFLLYFTPIILWAISRIIARANRRRRLKYSR